MAEASSCARSLRSRRLVWPGRPTEYESSDLVTPTAPEYGEMGHEGENQLMLGPFDIAAICISALIATTTAPKL